VRIPVTYPAPHADHIWYWVNGGGGVDTIEFIHDQMVDNWDTVERVCKSEAFTL